MAAAAYKVSLVLAMGSPNGPRKAFSYTASDVTTEYWLTQAGTSSTSFSSKDTYVVDAILSAAGTDTTQSVFYVNGAEAFRLLNATSIGTIVSRPLQLAPLKLPGGATLAVYQLA